MTVKKVIEERITELEEQVKYLDNDFYGRDYSSYLYDEVVFLKNLLKQIYAE